MSEKLLIGINGDFRAARKEAVALSWFNAGYYDTLTAGEAIPILIPPLADDGDLKQVLDRLDGLVIAGCNHDLDPVRLGMQKHPATRAMPARREDFDRRLCKLAVEMRLPTLAIGGGMQTLNVVCGGTFEIAKTCLLDLEHVTEEDHDDGWFLAGERLWIRYCHPSAPYSRAMMYYGLVGIYRSFLARQSLSPRGA